MSATFDPGPGWREVQRHEVGHEENIRLATAESIRWWVRETPVPPLPTAPYTIIRAQVSPDEPDVTLVFDGSTWLDIESGITARRLDRITSFEVLAEPRAVTAKAVAERIEHGATWDDIRTEFGVES